MATLFLILHMLFCIGLIVVVLLQETKSEGGLSGAISGWSQHSKSKYGLEEKLDKGTILLASLFFISCLVMYLVYPLFV